MNKTQTLINPGNLFFNINEIKRLISIQGSSFEVNPTKTYSNITNASLDYIKNKSTTNKIVIDLHFDIINSCCTRHLMEFIRTVGNQIKDKIHLQINWKYDNGNDDMLELGHDLASIFPLLSFLFIEMAEKK